MALDENDVGVLLDRLRPYFARFASDVVSEARRLGDIPELHPATVADTNTATGVIDVVPDGGGFASVPAASLIGIPEFGSRVMLLYQPPAGVFVVGYIGARRQPHVTGGLWQRVVSQSIASVTVTPISFDVQVRDSDGFVPIPGNTFTVAPNLPGRYLFTGAVTFAAAPSGRSFLELATSSYGHPVRTPMRGGDGEAVIGVSGFFNLNVGDTVQLIAYHTSFGTVGATAFLEAVRLLD